MFVTGQEYKRSALHDEIGGQRQGGISTPKHSPIVIAITGASGSRHGYDDWQDEYGVWHYYGEGRIGDMEFKGGNLAIRDHTINGKELHLFRHARRTYITYLGQYVCSEFEYVPDAPDTEGNPRTAIVFSLVPFESVDSDSGIDPELGSGRSRWEIPMDELRASASEHATIRSHYEGARRKAFHRSASLKVYVRRRAQGHCEGCGEAAPFISKSDGQPYLEPHHTTRLADGGPDHPEHVIALCPDCHRRVHHGLDGDKYNDFLIEKLRSIEGSPGKKAVEA